MDFADLKNKNLKELHEFLAEKRELARELRFKVGEKQLKDVRELREAKKMIARVLTLINQKSSKIN